jgi:hypothetical protein
MDSRGLHCQEKPPPQGPLRPQEDCTLFTVFSLSLLEGMARPSNSGGALRPQDQNELHAKGDTCVIWRKNSISQGVSFIRVKQTSTCPQGLLPGSQMHRWMWSPHPCWMGFPNPTYGYRNLPSDQSKLLRQHCHFLSRVDTALCEEMKTPAHFSWKGACHTQHLMNYASVGLLTPFLSSLSLKL